MLSPTSFWTQPLPIDAPIDPESATWVASVAGTIKNVNFLYRNTSIPLFWATEKTPRQKVWLDVKSTSRPKLQAALESVPIPPNFRPPGPVSGDRVVCLVCPKVDGSIEYFEFHGMHQVEIDGPATEEEAPECTWRSEPGWHCLAAAAVKDLRKNPGYVTEADWPKGIDFGPKEAPPWYGGNMPLWGCSASRTLSYHHTIKVAEAQRLYIPHALRFAIPRNLHRPEVRWPAVAADGESTNSAHPPTGSIFRFDPDDDFSDVADDFVRAVCVAIRDHGLVLTDSSGLTGTGAALKCETQATRYRSQEWGTDAWKGPEDEFGSAGAIFREGNEGNPSNETAPLGNQIPLGRLKILDASYRPSTVVAGHAKGA